MTSIEPNAKYSFVRLNQSRTCLSCGHIVRAKEDCKFCGAKAATGLPKIRCRYCRCEAPAGSQECLNCGEPLGGRCDTCGSSVAAEWRVCPICGTLRVDIKGGTVAPAGKSTAKRIAMFLLVLLLLGSWAVSGWLWWEREQDKPVWVGLDPDSVSESVTLPAKR